MIEVLLQIDAEDLGSAPDYVRVAREVHVDHEGVADHGQKQKGARMIHGTVVDGFQEDVEPVRDDQLLEEAVQHELKAEDHLSGVEFHFLLQLLSQEAVSGNGALHDVGEINGIEEEPDRVLFVLVSSPVDVQDVAYGGEGIVGNAQRDNDPGGAVFLEARSAVEEGRHIFGELDNAQIADAENDGQKEPDGRPSLIPGLDRLFLLFVQSRSGSHLPAPGVDLSDPDRTDPYDK